MHSAAVMDPAAAVPDARSGCWDFCSPAAGWLTASAPYPGGCHRGWCLWDGLGDLHRGPSPQLNMEFGMDPGPHDDDSVADMLTFCWRTAEEETENREPRVSEG